MNKIIKILTAVILTFAIVLCFTGCTESTKRALVDLKSEYTGGLDRTIIVYTANGEKIAEYSGKIDIEAGTSYVKFDFEGKRYIYYNCFVETIADI